MESLVLTQDCFHTGSEATQNDFKDTTVSEMEQFPSLLPLVNPPPLVYCDYCCQPILATTADQHSRFCIHYIHNFIMQAIDVVVSNASAAKGQYQPCDADLKALQQFVATECHIEEPREVSLPLQEEQTVLRNPSVQYSPYQFYRNKVSKERDSFFFRLVRSKLRVCCEMLAFTKQTVH
ncbi:hypothetical protein WA171_003893 [Blastocystis sp. BT1]